MKSFSLGWIVSAWLLLSPVFVFGQTPWDAIFMGKKQLCAAAMGDHAYWDQYWEGEQLIENGNIGRFQRSTFMPMVVYGITDGLDVIASLPYVTSRSTQGQMAGVSGFQDLNLAVKARLYSFRKDKHRLDFIGVLHFGTPVSNYLSDYMPYSLGLGCSELGLRGTVEYQFDSRWYTRLSVAHVWRGYSEIERDYYYQDGSYYSTFMKVPNAWNLHAALGWLHLDGRLRVELTYGGTKCTSGDDIRRWLRPQPTNKVMFDQVGAFAQYYFKRLPQVSVLGYVNHMIAGRNMGKFTNVTLGATYQIGFNRSAQ
jgi:hypothetical protein